MWPAPIVQKKTWKRMQIAQSWWDVQEKGEDTSSWHNLQLKNWKHNFMVVHIA